MKRVLFLVPSLGMGGMERVCINYVNLLSERGYQVSLYNLTSDSPLITGKLSANVVYKKEIMRNVPNIRNSSIKDLCSGNFRILPIERWLKNTKPEKLYKKLITDDPDMFDIEIAFYGGHMMKILTGSLQKESVKIGWIHSPMIESHYRLFKSPAQARETYRKMDLLCCVSAEVQRRAKELLGEDIFSSVILNPNDTARIRELAAQVPAELHKKCFTFINASRIDIQHKGFDRLVEAAYRLKQDELDFEIWILGDGTDFATLRAMIANYALDDVIHCFGAQENPYQYMANADCYICSSRFEGFSMVVAEAIIMGLPVISTNISGTQEMLGDSEYGIVTENSTDGIYHAMKDLLVSDEKKCWIKKQAELRRGFLDENAIIDRFEETLAELFARREKENAKT